MAHQHSSFSFSSIVLVLVRVAAASPILESSVTAANLANSANSANSAKTTKRFPASSRSNDESLERLILAQVYSLAYDEAQRPLYNGAQPECPSDSLVGNGAPDPAKPTPGELCAVVNYSVSFYENIDPRLWAAGSHRLGCSIGHRVHLTGL